jgi:hypothetical protein
MSVRRYSGIALVLALQCFGAHAELLFRSVEQVDGQQGWSSVRKYGNPSDVASRVSARGAAVQAQEVRVILSGPITRADVDSAGVMAKLLKSGAQKLSGNTVWMVSDGGDVDAGMDLGRLLRELGVYTSVAESDRCLSSCVFAFMGGERRSVAGRLGIHRPYFPYTQDSPDRKLRFRHLQKLLKSYVEELDFPASLYEAVMLAPPETMKMLSSAELKTFFLEGISPSSEDSADAAAARRLDLSMYEYLKYKAGGAAEGNSSAAAKDSGPSGGQARAEGGSPL